MMQRSLSGWTQPSDHRALTDSIFMQHRFTAVCPAWLEQCGLYCPQPVPCAGQNLHWCAFSSLELPCCKEHSFFFAPSSVGKHTWVQAQGWASRGRPVSTLCSTGMRQAAISSVGRWLLSKSCLTPTV